jgi:hemerythrin-like domain-containing protein
MRPTPLLADDGTASMATMIMLSHHAFRRDLARFARALDALDPARIEAVRAEWKAYGEALHGHHQKEDSDIFPYIRGEHAELAAAFDRLSAQHAQLDPMIERGHEAFARLPATDAAAAVVRDMQALLDAHLDEEEATLIPLLRAAKEFPTPATDDEAALYADGFAWAMHGVSPAVLDQVVAMLPDALRSRLPAARAAFEVRCERAWGPLPPLASETSIPST